MRDVQVATLAEIANLQSGGTPSKARDDYWEGDIPWLSGKTLHGTHVAESDLHVSEAGVKAGSNLAPPGASLVLVRGMSLLQEIRVGLVTRPVAFNQDVKAITAKPAVDPYYLNFALRAARPRLLQQVHQAGHGTGVLATDRLNELPIFLPPLPEQQRIAGVLGAFDDLIETNRATRRSMEALLATLFEHEGFDAQPTGAPARLGDVITVNPKEKKPSGEAPYVDMGMLPTDSALIGAPSSRPAAGGAKFRNGDTLVARITPCLENGKTAYVSNLPDDSVGVGSTEFIVLRGTDATGDYWPYCLARSPRFRSFAIQQLSDGSSGRQRIAASAVAEYRIPAPQAEALDRFRKVAGPLTDAMVQLHQEELSLGAQRDELLPLLMSGKVRVSEVEASLP